MKRPSFQFYPADWRKDPELRVCSIAARGLWIDMMCIMREAEPYGHLVVGGEPVTMEQLARLIGESVATVRRLLDELQRHQVFSDTDSGIIYSRRMVKDEALREKRGSYGRLSLDNPNVHRPKGAKGRAKGTGSARGRTRGLRRYATRPCARCGKPFRPTGPSARYCRRAGCEPRVLPERPRVEGDARARGLYSDIVCRARFRRRLPVRVAVAPLTTQVTRAWGETFTA